MIFKSRLRRKAEKMHATMIFRRCDIRKELDQTVKEHYNKLLIEDYDLRIQIRVLDKLLRS